MSSNQQAALALKDLAVTHSNKIKSTLGDAVLKVENDRQGVPILWVKKEKLVESLRYMKETDGLEYQFLADLTAYDDTDGPNEDDGRFVVVYQLYSPHHRTRIRVKTRAAENESVPTAIPLWEAANWAEREVFDMFGVKFEGHPDLRRILLDVRWQGHPLRKDYPLRKQQLFNDPETIPEHLLRD